MVITSDTYANQYKMHVDNLDEDELVSDAEILAKIIVNCILKKEEKIITK